MKATVHIHFGGRDAALPLPALYKELVDRFMRALADFKASTKDAQWREELHPRRSDGKFGHGGETASNGPAEKPTSVEGKTSKERLYNLLASGHPFTKAELMKIADVPTEQRLNAFMSFFKNPKYAAPRKALDLRKNKDGTYQVYFEGTETPAPPVPKPEEKPAAAPKPAPEPKKPEVPVAPPAPPAPAPKGFVPFVPQKNAKATAEWAVANNYADAADFGRLDMVTINAHMRSMEDHYEEFPELRKNAQFVGSIQAHQHHDHAIRVQQQLEKLRTHYAGRGVIDSDLVEMAKRRVKKGKAPANAWAYASQGSDGKGFFAYQSQSVCFNEAFGSATGAAHFEAQLRRSMDTGFHPPGCDTRKSVVDHEYGHQLDFLLGLRSHPEIRSLQQNGIPGQPGNGPANVSKYAAKNIQEFIAEAWAEAKNTTPRPVARRVAEIIRSEYAKKFPKQPVAAHAPAGARQGEPAAA